ncbi:hypothetical protein PR048_022654 [Dryococelus australis]|uniref:Uncharacterized protein n=1 Tax=Dryococelus australis TaxID=614101 RepID=A0ABQ9H1N8_9NEOP|nr:hypothetical protein PR048_022654 [Dryococelus australis]
MPPSFLPFRKTKVGTSKFPFESNRMLVSNCPKRDRSVLLLSTMHYKKDSFIFTTKRREELTPWCTIIPFIGNYGNYGQSCKKKYLQELGNHLAEHHMKKRALTKNLPPTIRKVANIQEEENKTKRTILLVRNKNKEDVLFAQDPKIGRQNLLA